MKKVILETSAFLTLLNNEQGKDIIEPLLSNSIMSSLSVAEIVTSLSQLLIPSPQIHKILFLINEVISFDKQASIAASLLNQKYPELTLTERATLILAKELQLPLYTAKTSWNLLDLTELNIEIIIIR